MNTATLIVLMRMLIELEQDYKDALDMWDGSENTFEQRRVYERRGRYQTCKEICQILINGYLEEV